VIEGSIPPQVLRPPVIHYRNARERDALFRGFLAYNLFPAYQSDSREAFSDAHRGGSDGSLVFAFGQDYMFGIGGGSRSKTFKHMHCKVRPPGKNRREILTDFYRAGEKGGKRRG
jgi:hypothetical protein